MGRGYIGHGVHPAARRRRLRPRPVVDSDAVDAYREIISGRRRGAGAAVARAGLAALSGLYGLGVAIRAAAYAAGLKRPARIAVPVISVGNLMAGGTGKTPMCEALARAIARQGRRVAIVARGYGPPGPAAADDEEPGADVLPSNVLRLTGARRVLAARRAVAEHGAQVILLDDGFQHRAIARDLNLMLIDATEPFAESRLLPRGLRREPFSALRRADAFVLTRTDQAASDQKACILAALAGFGVGDRPVIEAAHQPTVLRNTWDGSMHDPDWLRGKRVYGFAGIGNPDAFRRTLESLGAEVVRFRAFPDHHPYRASDLRRIDGEAQEFMAEVVATTEKDAARLRPGELTLPPHALRIRMAFPRGEDMLMRLVDRALRGAADAATVG